MNRKNFSPLFKLSFFILFLYSFHSILFYATDFKKEEFLFQFSLNFLYLFFGIVAVLIATILLVVKSKSIDNLGMVFMIVTTLKMCITFFVFKPIMHPTSTNYSTIEKPNFFIVFTLFLILETLFGIWLLNKKET